MKQIEQQFAMTDTELYIPVVTSLTQDNMNLWNN